MARRRLFLPIIENGAAETDAALAALPVALHTIPVSRIEPCAAPAALETAKSQWREFDWVLFTSANAVKIFFASAAQTPGEDTPRIACVGPNTADAVRALGYSVAFVASEHTGNAFAREFAEIGTHGGEKILLPRPEKMASAVPDILTEAGLAVTQLVLYRTVPLETAPPSYVFTPRDMFAFTSPSGAKHFARWYTIPPESTVFAIGPVTTAAVRQWWPVRVHAAEDASRNGLVDAIRAFLDNAIQET